MEHFQKYCRKAGNFPKKNPSSTKRVHIAGATEENEFCDEDGNLCQKVQNHMLSTVQGRKELLIELQVGTEFNSIDKEINVSHQWGNLNAFYVVKARNTE